MSVSTSAPASAHNRGRPLSSISFRNVEVSLHNTFGYSFAGLEPMGLSPAPRLFPCSGLCAYHALLGWGCSAVSGFWSCFSIFLLAGFGSVCCSVASLACCRPSYVL